VTHRGPFQHLPFCDSVILIRHLASSGPARRDHCTRPALPPSRLRSPSQEEDRNGGKAFQHGLRSPSCWRARPARGRAAPRHAPSRMRARLLRCTRLYWAGLGRKKGALRQRFCCGRACVSSLQPLTSPRLEALGDRSDLFL